MPRADEEEEGGQPGPVRPITLEEEFARNPELTKTDLEYLREWGEKQPHLPKMLDRELVMFLHSCYFRMEAAKTTMDSYFTARTHVPEFFRQRDISRPELIQAVNTACIFRLPKPTPEGYKVVMARLTDTRAAHFVHADIFRQLFMLIDMWLLTEGTCPGYQLVIDMEGVTFGHVARLNVALFKKIFFYIQEALPWRLKGLCFINSVPFVDIILGMFKPFVKPELMDVMQVHNGIPDKFYSIVPQKIMPVEYGGTAPSYHEIQKRALPLLRANLAWFEAEDLRVVDESKRPGKGRSAGDLFGMEGSFKKLAID